MAGHEWRIKIGKLQKTFSEMNTVTDCLLRTRNKSNTNSLRNKAIAVCCNKKTFSFLWLLFNRYVMWINIKVQCGNGKCIWELTLIQFASWESWSEATMDYAWLTVMMELMENLLTHLPPEQNSRRRRQIYFHEWKVLYFDSNFTSRGQLSNRSPVTNIHVYVYIQLGNFWINVAILLIGPPRANFKRFQSTAADFIQEH